jgi:hypothetical protein
MRWPHIAMVALLAGYGDSNQISNGGSTSGSTSSGSSSGMGALCVPGQQIECACPGGGKGAQKCRADGTGFEACDGCKSAGSTSGGQSGATSSSAASGGGGAGGATSSSGSSGSGGAPPECMTPTDCGTDTTCLSWTCSDGKCGKNHAAEGTPLAQQSPGDCSQLVCDGQGSTKAAFDAADVQSDGKECTVDACTTQGTTHTAKPTGTPCSSGLCDASQACVAHIPVQCQIKNGGPLYVGCEGIYHPGLIIAWSDGVTGGVCQGTPQEAVYCPPGATCGVSIGGIDQGFGTCK